MDNIDSSQEIIDESVTEFTCLKTKSKKTLFRKEGQSNIIFQGIKSRRRKYLKDIYITMLDIQWRWALLIVFSGFFVSCVFFSAIYFFCAYINGDFSHTDDPHHAPCITSIKSYWDVLLFSVETQSTIGYGTMYPHSECVVLIPVVFIQTVLRTNRSTVCVIFAPGFSAFLAIMQVTCGFLLESTLLGFIFMKVARPKNRRHTLLFSKNACICKEDKQLTLQIRVGDIRNTHLIDVHLQGILLKQHVTAENNVYPLFQHKVEFSAHRMTGRLFLFYPMVMSHKITPDSPLYLLAPEDLRQETFEILVVLEGTIESTGVMVQAKTSIPSTEIRWGYRFVQIEEYDEANDKWCINFKKFNQVVHCETA